MSSPVRIAHGVEPRKHRFRMRLATRVRATGPGPVPAGDAAEIGKAASASESEATMAPNEQVATTLPSGVAKRADETLKTV